MSVQVDGLICPASNQHSKLEDIEAFISELVKTNYALNNVLVITGEADKIKDIRLRNFEYTFSIRGVDKLLPDTGLEIVTDRSKLSEQVNYVFRIMLCPNNPESAGLHMFDDKWIKDGPRWYPMFLLYLAQSTTVEAFRSQTEEQFFIDDINSYIKLETFCGEIFFEPDERQEKVPYFLSVLKELYPEFITSFWLSG